MSNSIQTDFYSHDDTMDLLESFNLRGRLKLENLRLGKHVSVNAEHYAHAMCDANGQLREDCFLNADPQEKEAFDAKAKELTELGMSVQMSPEQVLKHLIRTEPHDSSLLNKVYHQAKAYDAQKPLEISTHRPVISQGTGNAAEKMSGHDHIPGSPELKARQTRANEILDKQFTDSLGNLKIEGFFTEPKWKTQLDQVRQKIASELGLALPVSPMQAVRKLLDDPNPRVGHDLRETLIRQQKFAHPVLGKHTQRVAHVTDDPEVARRIYGDAAQR